MLRYICYVLTLLRMKNSNEFTFSLKEEKKELIQRPDKTQIPRIWHQLVRSWAQDYWSQEFENNVQLHQKNNTERSTVYPLLNLKIARKKTLLKKN